MVVRSGFTVDCSGGIIFFFFLFYVTLNTVKYFLTIFQNATKHRKKIIFPEIIYIFKHFTMKNNLQRNKRSLGQSGSFMEFDT